MTLFFQTWSSRMIGLFVGDFSEKNPPAWKGGRGASKIVLQKVFGSNGGSAESGNHNSSGQVGELGGILGAQA
jgi:hypothetical protein